MRRFHLDHTHAIALGFAWVAVFLIAPRSVSADEYSIEKIGAAEEAEGVSKEIAELISDEGVRVTRDSSRTVCEIWLSKDLAYDPGFTPTPVRLYPFEPGQLVGLLHFPRRSSEFRDQTISSGWYTLRFALQPIDGNHIGTSPTRDFLVLVEAENDELPEKWDEDDLNEASAEAAGSAHPAMLCLKYPIEDKSASIRHDEANDWSVLHLLGKGKSEAGSKEIPIDVVVAGHAVE